MVNAEEMETSKPKFKLFSNLSEEEFNNLSSEPKSVYMSRVRQFGYSKLARFAAITNTDLAATTRDMVKLDSFLSRFYAGLRKGDGTSYANHSIKVIRYGVHCYYRDVFKYKITDKILFPKSNRVYKGVCRKLAKEGRVQQSPLVSPEDMEKIQNSQALDCTTPCGLQNKVFIDIMACFSIHSKEILRTMQPSDFKVETDKDGLRYISRKATGSDASSAAGDNLQAEAHSGEHSTKKIKRMYETPRSERCPVESFLKYVSKLGPRCSFLWQKPEDVAPSFDHEPWYKDTPVGQNTLGCKMKEISRKARCSKSYTNFSLRSSSTSTVYGQGSSNLVSYDLDRNSHGSCLLFSQRGVSMSFGHPIADFGHPNIHIF